MKDMNDFVAVNKIYEAAFGEHKPARSVDCLVRLGLHLKFTLGLLLRLRVYRKTLWWRLRLLPNRECSYPLNVMTPFSTK